jgi:hypothetical protein
MYYCQVAPVPTSFLARIISEAEKKGYHFVTQCAIGVVGVRSLDIKDHQEIALTVVLCSENKEPFKMENISID